jgi:ParB family transcriptional regulator, chromosome partitioning protein
MGGQAFKAPRLNGFKLDPNEIVIVGGDGPNDVDKNDEDGELHHLYDERVEIPLRDEFVQNVMTLGIKKNVTVEKIGEAAYVVDGRQRVRAAREANRRLAKLGEPLLRVPVVLQTGEESLMMTIGVATNEFHHDDPPLTKARKAQRLRDRGLSDDEIAVAFGVSTKAVSNWEKMLSLSAPVKKAIEKGKVSASAAAQLHDLPAPAQKEQLDKLIEEAKTTGKAPTIKSTKSAAKSAKGQSPNAAPSKKILRAIVESPEHQTVLSEDFLAGVAFAIGLRDAKSVNGLSGVVKAVQEAKAAKKAKKASKGNGKATSKRPEVAKKKGAKGKAPADAPADQPSA